jgi:hypothetical protein
MSKSNSFETSFLSLIFNNINIDNIGDASGLPVSAVEGSFWLRLYTDAIVVDDSTIGTEASYIGYVNGGVAVSRNAAGWTVSDNTITNTSAITFGLPSSSGEVIRYFSIWKDNSSSVDSDRLYWGQLSSDLIIGTGYSPEFSIGSLQINEN